jgi:hypothetical protein
MHRQVGELGPYRVLVKMAGFRPAICRATTIGIIEIINWIADHPGIFCPASANAT